MINDNIFTLIREYEDNFENFPVEIVDGYDFDQLQQIKEINLYWSSKFISGQSEDKYFFNIIKHRVKNASKNIDVDTKDVLVRTRGGGDHVKTWIARRDIKRWLDSKHVGNKMNETKDKLPLFGSIVAKRVNNDEIFELVNVRNLKCDPTAKSLEESSYVIEDYYMTPDQVQDFKGVWDNVDELLENYKTYRKENYTDDKSAGVINTAQGDSAYMHLRSFYGFVPESLWNKYNDIEDTEGSEYRYKRVYMIVSLPEDKADGRNNSDTQDNEGLILYKEDRDGKDGLYKECHYDRIDGRWLGVGLVEDGQRLQEIKNKQINQLIEAQDLANTVLFQSGDPELVENILTDLENGDIIHSKQPINPINTNARNLNIYSVINQEIEQLYNSLSNTYEVTTGESLPSGTPFSLGALINRNAQKHFDQVREKLGMFWEEILQDWVLPEILKDINKKHILEITNKDEAMEINKILIKNKVWDATTQYVLAQGNSPTQEEVTEIEAMLGRYFQEQGTFLDIPKDYYKGAEKDIQIIIVNEKANKEVETQELMTALQIVTQNPALAQSPLFKKILDWIGVSEMDLRGFAPPPQQIQQIMQGAQEASLPMADTGANELTQA